MPEAEGLNKHELIELLENLGNSLDFDARTEVEASESAWVDVVWFDKHLPVGEKPFKMRNALVLPVVAFEVEWGTGLNAKHVKGSVSNLNNLGAQLGVIVIAQHNLVTLQKLPSHAKENPKELQKILSDRVNRWVYSEAQAKSRIIVMFEREFINWAKGLKPSLIGVAPLSAVSPAASP